MNLGEIRTQLIKESGRFDLVSSVVSEPYTDNGANYYINVGQRLLDNLQEIRESFAWFKVDLSVNQVFQTLDSVRAIKEVWMSNADSRFILEKKELGWLKETYAKPVSDLTSGQPTYYARSVIHLAPEQEAITSSDYDDTFTYGWEDLVFQDTTDRYKKTGIVWMPPADEAYTLEVLGQFFTKTLSADADKSFWTIQYPEILIKAANYALESVHRNREGMRDWLEGIKLDLQGIDFGLVEEDISGINQMEED